ncbi:HGGxSTG domain-containing protein [Rhodoplanes sp. SY1]|uniref:HGGxSTG domain-containing protein n=1 Tax=Rhodoplanes sp. SY1 TaxID=3166646 RepID=UPI0038B4685E
MSKSDSNVSAPQPRRCGAKTRNGTPCRTAPVTGKKRCRMHGGARGSGAPRGNTNAMKHGFYTKVAKAERRYWAQLERKARTLLSSFEDV